MGRHQHSDRAQGPASRRFGRSSVARRRLDSQRLGQLASGRSTATSAGPLPAAWRGMEHVGSWRCRSRGRAAAGRAAAECARVGRVDGPYIADNASAGVCWFTGPASGAAPLHRHCLLARSTGRVIRGAERTPLPGVILRRGRGLRRQASSSPSDRRPVRLGSALAAESMRGIPEPSPSAGDSAVRRILKLRSTRDPKPDESRRKTRKVR